MTRSLTAHARPFPLDAGAPPTAPPAVFAAADVVGLASSVRTAREVVLATHVLLRGLVERAGFRAVFIEGSEPVGGELATYVAAGGGSPATLISAAQGFLRFAEAVDVVRWLRRWNETHPDDPVALVHDPEPAQPGSLKRPRSPESAARCCWNSARPTTSGGGVRCGPA